MVVRFLNRLLYLFNYSLILSSTEEKREKKIVNEMLKTVQELLKAQQDERKFFRDWATGFQQTTEVKTAPKRLDDDIVEALEHEAQRGSELAQDILADEARLKDYLRLTRDSYY